LYILHQNGCVDKKIGKINAVMYNILSPANFGGSVQTLRQRARENPNLLVTRKEANEILDFEWEMGLFPEQVRALWKELEDEYCLKVIFDREGIIRRYHLDEVREALARHQRGERKVVEQTVFQDEPWPPLVMEWEEGDDDVITAREACERLSVRRSDPTGFARVLGAKPVEFPSGSNRCFKFRYGDIRRAYEQRTREQFED
jgi:hypothetical protein